MPNKGIAVKEKNDRCNCRSKVPVSSADGFEDSLLLELGDRPVTTGGFDFESVVKKIRGVVINQQRSMSSNSIAAHENNHNSNNNNEMSM